MITEVITYIRVLDGVIKKGDKNKIWSTEKKLEVLELGIFLI